MELFSLDSSCRRLTDLVLPSGTTVKGAVDDLDLILKTLERVGYTEDRFYIHVDGALFGLMMPFVKKVSNLGISLHITMSKLPHNLEQKCSASSSRRTCHGELLLISGKVDYSIVSLRP